MAKKFTNKDPYDADVDTMFAMLSNKDYWSKKYEELGASNVTFNQFDASDSAVTVQTERDVPADLPGFAKKIVGDSNHVTQTEAWKRSGDSLHCEITIAVKNVPGGTTGTMDIKPAGAGTAWSADFDIKVSIPMLGGKFEKLMVDETGKSFVNEKKFNDTWLTSH